MDLIYFEQWVKKELKIELSAYKSNQLHRRILSLISRSGIKTVDEYINLLKSSSEHRQKFLDFITINVTEFFRNPELFHYLEKVMEKEKLFDKKLNIWSAACSNGAEPYSIAMLLDSRNNKIRHNINATDIDATILQKAKRGEYVENDIKNVKQEFLKKYFTTENGKYNVTPAIKNMVNFKKHDLILDSYQNNLDLIVCRNVVIYFNLSTKHEIYKNFSKALKSGGILFVGATEAIYNYRNYNFEKLSTFIYKRI